MKTPASLEPLEQRIAPAVVIAANGLSATFNDVDGDRVTVTVSKGHLDPADFSVKAGFIGDQLELLNLSDDGSEFAGADVSISATPQQGIGDGFVNVGWINSTGRPLGKVAIDGDLGKISAGTGAGTAMKSLVARSLGLRGLETGAPDLSSDLKGSVGTVRILGDVTDAKLNIDKNAGTIVVRGSVHGDDLLAGRISVNGDVDTLKIGGSVIGGEKAFSGIVSVDGRLGALTIRGSVIGGDGLASGSVLCHEIGFGHVFGSLVGGTGTQSGNFELRGGNVAIDGGIHGGTGSQSARLHVLAGAPDSVVNLAIKGGIEGGAGGYSGAVEWQGSHGSIRVIGGIHGAAGKLSGSIFTDADPTVASKPIDAVIVRGDITGGTGEYSGSVTAKELHFVRTTGDLVGGAGQDSGEISLRTGMISAFTIGGDVRGGSGTNSGRVNFDSSGLPEAPSGGVYKFGGSIIGGSGGSSGSTRLNITNASSISLGGSVIGGSGPSSGVFGASGASLVTIGGSIIGGSANGSGLLSVINPETLKIAGSVIGGSLNANAATDLDNTGAVEFSSVNNLIIGGSVAAGTNESATKNLTRSGYIASNLFGNISIGGSVIGSTTNQARIVAEAGFTPGNAVIRSLNIGGSVSHADILAGYLRSIAPFTADVKVGKISVGGDWIASNLAVGTIAGNDGAFGTSDDELIPSVDTAPVASVASIIIKGQALGDGTASTAKFGFSAEKFKSVNIGGIALALTASADTKPIGSTADLSLHDLV